MDVIVSSQLLKTFLIIFSDKKKMKKATGIRVSNKRDEKGK